MKLVVVSAVCLLCVFLNVKLVQCDLNLLVDLWNYSNPYTASQCCSENKTTASDCTYLNCTIRIKICVDKLEKINEVGNLDSCYYGSFTTSEINETNSHGLKANQSAIFNIAWIQNQSPHFLLKIYVFDTKVIDYYVLDLIANTTNSSESLEWTSYPLYKGQNTSNIQTYISFSVATKCSDNFYSSNCNVKCIAQDDCAHGHYTCDKESGEKVCKFGFIDSSTNCITRNSTIKLCPKSDDEFCNGNGICFLNSTKSSSLKTPICCCDRGINGTNCNEIESCDINPCKNGATCIRYLNINKCTCKQGFTGKFCETKILCPKDYYGINCTTKCVPIDSCETHQACNYNGNLTCQDGWGNFPECNKRLVDQSIDPECPDTNTSMPCLNGGSCWNKKCCCPPRFTGAHCEINNIRSINCQSNEMSCFNPNIVLVNPCNSTSSSCSNNGVCVPFLNNTDYFCSCFEGYTGKSCDTFINNCDSQPCVNNGTCISFLSSFYCKCSSGFTGHTCETRLSPCLSQPCVHGKCRSDSLDSYTCECDSGWSNSNKCNEDINECLAKPSPCLNNSTCINEPGMFKCICQDGFTGEKCENKINYCAFQACHHNNSIKCINNYTVNNFVCVCKPGYSGYLCDSEINECTSHPCQNGATCIDNLNGFKCLCPPGYTGQTCSTVQHALKALGASNTNPCLANPLTNTTVCGIHGLCYPSYLNSTTFSSNYTCVCMPGYTGLSCSSLINYCALNMCQNSASCQSMLGYYNCKCLPNFYGINCEYFLQCSLNPCNQAGTLQCIDMPPVSNSSNNFSCKCKSGFYGTFCESETNECQSNPCLNNGVCVDLINAYSCECVGNYIGKNCEIAYDFCKANLCASGSTCVNIQNDFKCLCPTNYTGAFCDQKVDPCSSSPCLHDGVCESTPNGPVCICMPAYTGPTCSLFIDICQQAAQMNTQSFCQNNSTCISLSNTFFCSCPKGYTGQYCQVKIGDCTATSCKNGGLCTPDKTCLCLPQYTGSFCESLLSSTPCGSFPCKNKGTCFDNGNGYVCKCATNYSGTNCEIRNGYCASSPCLCNQTCVEQLNGYNCVEPCSLKPCQFGSCLNMGAAYKCVCLPGYTGTNCDQKIDLCNNATPVCFNNATCITNSNVSSCICHPGYAGVRCEILSDPCATQPCMRGTCSNLANLQYKCSCPSGFTGKNCEADIDECRQYNSSSICYNNSTCVNTLGSYTCHCLNGFMGNFCEFALDVCVSNPCLNNARCENRIGGLFTCVCPLGYSGLRCEIVQTQCSSNPCLNSGTCIINPPGGFQCICKSGYAGPRCEIVTNICDTKPCQNGALCQQKASNTFACICLPNYTGDRCQTLLQTPCQSSPCKNGATCLDVNLACVNSTHCVTSYKCFCASGYTGPNCEIFSNPCIPNPCLNQGVCLVSLPYYFQCQCKTGYSGFYCQFNDDLCQKQTCLVNFTSQALSIYSESDSVSFDSYRSCILNTWQSLNPIVLANQIVKLTLVDAKKSLEFTNNMIANHCVTLYFDISIANSLSTNTYRVPVPSDYNQYCSNIVVNPVVTYNKFWDLYLCGYYSSTSSDLDKLKQTLANVWRTKLSYLGASYSLSIDIFTNRIEYLSAQGQPIITRFQYLVYASPYKLIIEKGVVNDFNRIPTESEFNQALVQNNFLSCRNNVLQPSVFTVNVCGILNKNDIDVLVLDIRRAWQSDTQSGGLGSNNVDITFIDQQEFLTDDIKAQATKVSYTVAVNGQQVDSSFSFSYDYFRILEIISLRRSLCVPNYAISNAFFIITPNRICSSSIENINTVVNNLVIPSIQNAYVKIVFVSYGVEEVIDSNGQIFYQLPLFVIANNKFLNPNTNLDVYNFLVQKFNSIVYKSPSEYFQAYSVYSQKYYRTSTAFKFYFNEKIADSNLILVSNLIKQAFELTNQEYAFQTQVQILLQQDVILRNQYQNALNVNRLYAVISNIKNNMIYDSRVEPSNLVTQNLANYMNTLNPPILTGSGAKLSVFDNLDPKNIVQYSELFVLYLTNYCLEINSNDLIKISSWLNSQWNSVLKISLNIVIVNVEKYFDVNQSNVVIGINYLVSTQTPLCNDYTSVENSIRDNFNSLLNDLCNCGYKYYNYQGGLLRPFRNFYTLDFIGNVIDQEIIHRGLIQTSVSRAWSKLYPAFNNTISMPTLSTRFQYRLTLLGSEITRVFYTIFVNNKLASSSLQQQPTYQAIQDEILNAKFDLKIYTYNDSVCKHLLSSLFVKTYPLKPAHRNVLQNNINTALQGSIYNPLNENSYVVVVYHELYQSQAFNYNVSRVYYFYNVGGNMYTSKLFDLYATDVYAVPSQKSFDYLVRSRYIDLMPPFLLTDTDTLKALIVRTWLGSNNNLLISQINVNLAEIKYYTSAFASNYIQRVYYFLTILNSNVNDYYVPSVSYYEPTISDFAQNAAQFANMSFYFPSKAFRTYISSVNNTVNEQAVRNYLISIWIGNNLRVVSTMIDVVITNKFKFFDAINVNVLKSSNVIRITYTILYNQYADQNDLFVAEPTVSNNFTNGNCYPTYCLPVLYYDFYTLRNISINEALIFVNNIKQAWAVQNFRTYDIFFQNQLRLNLYSVVPYGPNNGGDIVFRLIYSIGFAGNYGQQRPLYPGVLDIYDLGPPNDANYNSFLSQYLTVIDRKSSLSLKPYDINKLLVDTVVGIQWWMILIIVISFVLIIIFLILCVYRLKVKRKSEEKYENITSSESLNNVSRLDYRNAFDTDRYSSNLRTETLSVSGRNMNSDQFTVSTTSRQLDSERRNLNLPQQYEAIIN